MPASSQFFSPHAMAAKVKPNRGTVIILRLVLGLRVKDGLLAYDAGVTRAVTGPNQCRCLDGKDTGVQLLTDDLADDCIHPEEASASKCSAGGGVAGSAASAASLC